MESSKRKTESFAERALLALDLSFRKLVLERRRTNDTLILWKDGKVCLIPAAEVPLPDDIDSESAQWKRTYAGISFRYLDLFSKAAYLCGRLRKPVMAYKKSV